MAAYATKIAAAINRLPTEKRPYIRTDGQPLTGACIETV
jgi:hypothetical protein